MRNNKNIWLTPVTFILILGVGVYSYLYYFSPPKPFYSNDELVMELNKISDYSTVMEIQDIIFLDENRVFVPYITTDEDYSSSYWTWEKNNWNAIAHYNNSIPFVWSSKKGQDTFFVWNLNPRDNIKSIDFYMIRDRYYHIMTEGDKRKETYDPRIQFTHNLKIKEQSYGVESVPAEWQVVSNLYGESEKTESTFFSYPTNMHIIFGWMPYEENGDRADVRYSAMGGGFHYSYDGLNFMTYVNESELE
ncbi:MAG: hypothetical protein LPK00_14535 [Bacillaceae bacterium]|nr:hypothetical protein [Bacillaceae bacterium]